MLKSVKITLKNGALVLIVNKRYENLAVARTKQCVSVVSRCVSSAGLNGTKELATMKELVFLEFGLG